MITNTDLHTHRSQAQVVSHIHCVPKKVSPSNFIRIPYSVYEMFNSFKLLSQISVTDTTYFLLTSSVKTHDLWVMLFKNSYFSKVKADLYETM